MSTDEESAEHVPALEGELTLTPAQQRHEAWMHAVQAHMDAARPAVSILVARARVLVRNGVDLRNPERVLDFVDDQICDAVKQATVHACSCAGAQGSAAMAVLAEVTHQLAVLLEERDR